MTADALKLSAEALRWCCDLDALDFDTTDEVKPETGIIGQDDAVAALTFGLEIQGAGTNVFVRGLPGTGRMTLVSRLLESHRPLCGGAPDRCYVHNFEAAERPRLLSLPRGTGGAFRSAMNAFASFVGNELADVLGSDAARARLTELEERMQGRLRELGKPFEAELRANDLALVQMQMGQVVQPVILPVIDSQAVSFADLEQLRVQEKISDADVDAVHDKIGRFSRRLEDLNHQIREVQAGFREEFKSATQTLARSVLNSQIDTIKNDFSSVDVAQYLASVVEDIVIHRLSMLAQAEEFLRLYRVNVLCAGDGHVSCPVVVEDTPSVSNLFGSIEREVTASSVFRSDHLMIKAGALLRADGGYLVLDAREVAGEPGAWKLLMRTLRTGKLEIAPTEPGLFWSGALIKPDPVEINVKVVLVGDPDLYDALDTYDPDFPTLFKVLADFETTIERNADGVRYYAGVLAHLASKEDMLPFTRDAVSAWCEHGARIAGQRDRLTVRFGRLADVAREAAYLAKKACEPAASAERVHEAIARGRHRADLPARKFRKLITEGVVRIETAGAVVGQINGLAVVHAGPLTYGFPTRITATIGPGTAGTVSIEREAQLSGAIHTKGFYILEGLLRYLLRTTHPLAFSASIAFEQSYGGIDGDSASGAEMCCLISALTEAPINQGLAMTGAIDQLGHIQPIGAVSEKVEGFFNVCMDRGLTGQQGVLIPRANAGDLMVNEQVVEACRRSEFSIYAVDTIHEALAILTGKTVTPHASDGSAYPHDSLLHIAVQRARHYWLMASRTDVDTVPVQNAQTEEAAPSAVPPR